MTPSGDVFAFTLHLLQHKVYQNEPNDGILIFIHYVYLSSTTNNYLVNLRFKKIMLKEPFGYASQRNTFILCYATSFVHKYQCNANHT